MDLVEVFIMGLIGFLSGALVMVFAYYQLKRSEFLEESLTNFLTTVQNDEELQKALYTIGGIIGQGAKAGFGVAPKTGRFKWQDLIVDLGTQYLQKTIINPSPSPTPTPTPTQKDLLPNKRSDQW